MWKPSSVTLSLLMVLAASALPAEALRVGVSVLPLEPLVEAIGGDAVEVRSLQREGDSCSVFEPRPSAVNWLAGAGLFFRIGAGYESAILEKVDSRFPNLLVDDLREGMALITYGVHEHHDHGDHDGHDCPVHDEEATDPHVWLDPVRLAVITERISVRLGELLPEKRSQFEDAARELRNRLAAVHAQIEVDLAPFRGRAFYIYHPAMGYFADRYGLRQVSIASSIQGPTARELHRVISQARKEAITTIFVQPQENHKHAEVVADAVGAQVVEIDPMSTDLERNLIQIGKALSDSFGRH